MRATTAIHICSRASILIGANPISSFAEGTVEADIAEAMYEDIARSALTNTRWRFATNQFQLNRLVNAPTGSFDAAYQLPSDCLMVNAVTVDEMPLIYTIYGDMIYCDASENDVVVADYIFRAEEVNWPSYFTVAVEYSMAAVMALSVARDGQLAQLMEQKAAMLMSQARRLDSQQQTTRKLNTSKFIAQRRS